MTLITRRSLLRDRRRGRGAAAARRPRLRAGAAQGRLRLSSGRSATSAGPMPTTRAARRPSAAFGDKIETTYVENVAEGPDSERVIRNLAEDGNQLIFTSSFGFMNPTIKVAKRFPDVKFEHCSGYQRADNVATYNARFYEGRAVCGTIAGHMSKTGIAGYIASFPIPEVVMGINAFTLAAQQGEPGVQDQGGLGVDAGTTRPRRRTPPRRCSTRAPTSSPSTPTARRRCRRPSSAGCSPSARPGTCRRFAPKAHLTAIENDWGVYYIDRIQKMLDGAWTSADTWWGFKEGMLKMAPSTRRSPRRWSRRRTRPRPGSSTARRRSSPARSEDQAGEEKAAAGAALDDARAPAMDWYVEGVQS